jgi:hypothetical protein
MGFDASTWMILGTSHLYPYYGEAATRDRHDSQIALVPGRVANDQCLLSRRSIF